MSLSSNNFSKNQPAKSGNSFSTKIVPSSSTFSSSNPNESNLIFSGDNTAGGVYGGDFETFGDIYGQNQYGGLTHFKTRISNTPTH